MAVTDRRHRGRVHPVADCRSRDHPQPQSNFSGAPMLKTDCGSAKELLTLRLASTSDESLPSRLSTHPEAVPAILKMEPSAELVLREEAFALRRFA